MSKEYMRREVERFIDRCKLIMDCTEWTHDIGLEIPDSVGTEALFFMKEGYEDFMCGLKGYWGI